MNERERKKIRANELIQIILRVPNDEIVPKNTEEKVNMLMASIDIIKSQVLSNASKTETIQENNVKLTEDNLYLKNQNESIQKELNEIRVHVDGMEQYLRINNIEAYRNQVKK